VTVVRGGAVALFAVNVVSNIGKIFTTISAPWFVLRITGISTKTGSTGAVTALSFIASSFGGALMDHIGFKRDILSRTVGDCSDHGVSANAHASVSFEKGETAWTAVHSCADKWHMKLRHFPSLAFRILYPSPRPRRRATRRRHRIDTGWNFGQVAVFPPGADTGETRDHDRRPSLSDRIGAQQGAGLPLATPVQRTLETGFGHDIGAIRIHADSEADALSRSIDARAFTSGQDIFFRAGAYQPKSGAGLHLLAHEVAHTVQQADGPIAGTPTADGVSISDPADSYEQAAEQAADAIAGPEGAPVQGGAMAPAQPRHAGAETGLAQQGLLVQRGPEDKARMDDLQHQQDMLKKRVAALELDAEWRGKYMERFSSYKQAILRVTAGLDAAGQAFQNALQQQAALDQVWAQVVFGAMTAICALPMEWVALQAGGILSQKGKALKSFVERFENPANAVVAAGGNAGAAGIGLKNTSANQAAPGGAPAAVPYLTGGAIGFFARNTEVVESQTQELELAFADRANKARSAPDDFWQTFDLAAQGAMYKELLDGLTSQVGGVEKLKDAQSIALIFERHLFAQWLRTKKATYKANVKAQGRDFDFTETEEQKEKSAEEQARNFIYEGLGSYVEDEMNRCGIGGLAGVELTGHWYSSNSSGYQAKLNDWATGYKESIVQ
jgi:hypothetical protein